MKFNIYFLLVGILSILFGFTHAMNGHSTILLVIDAADFETVTKTTIFYIWHIITIENIIFGIAFLVMACYKEPSKVKFAAWLIAIIILARWVIIFGTTLIKDIEGIGNILVDSIAIIIFVGLIILGIRRNDKISNRKDYI